MNVVLTQSHKALYPSAFFLGFAPMLRFLAQFLQSLFHAYRSQDFFHSWWTLSVKWTLCFLIADNFGFRNKIQKLTLTSQRLFSVLIFFNGFQGRKKIVCGLFLTVTLFDLLAHSVLWYITIAISITQAAVFKPDWMILFFGPTYLRKYREAHGKEILWAIWKIVPNIGIRRWLMLGIVLKQLISETHRALFCLNISDAFSKLPSRFASLNELDLA